MNVKKGDLARIVKPGNRHHGWIVRVVEAFCPISWITEPMPGPHYVAVRDTSLRRIDDPTAVARDERDILVKLPEHA